MFLYGFSSCTCLYEWVSIFLWVFVLYMFVRMTIYIILMGFRHVHVCTNDYPFPLNGFSSFTCLYEWLSNSLCIGFHDAHFSTNDYPILLNGFSSCTCLYEWLSNSFEWVFVMNISVRMTTISFWMDCRHLHFCTNDNHFFLNGLSSFTFLIIKPGWQDRKIESVGEGKKRSFG